jgi:hypothetical protein
MGDVDYTEMYEPELLTVLGQDHELWAKAFCQYAKKHGEPIPNEECLAFWFANAMMNCIAPQRSIPVETPITHETMQAASLKYLKEHGLA